MTFTHRQLPFLAVLLAASSLWHCAGNRAATEGRERVLLAAEVQKWLHEVVPSVVGVAGVFNYRRETYNHRYVDGRLVPDADSPTGFQLLTENEGPRITRASETQKVNGAGLIIYRDDRRAVILTCAHILTKPDTLVSYLRDETGRLTGVIHSRSIRTGSSFHLIGQINQLIEAEIVRLDIRYDLALVEAQASPALGSAFPFSFSYSQAADWGDQAYVIGYPREIKQVTSGLVSRVPHAASFVVDIVARFGFSGGPVLVIRPGQGLDLAGLVRGVPVNKLSYLAPPVNIATGDYLLPEDLTEITAQEVDLIDYGTAYAVGIETVGKFLQASTRELERRGVILARKYLPD